MFLGMWKRGFWGGCVGEDVLFSVDTPPIFRYTVYGLYGSIGISVYPSHLYVCIRLYIGIPTPTYTSGTLYSLANHRLAFWLTTDWLRRANRAQSPHPRSLSSSVYLLNERGYGCLFLVSATAFENAFEPARGPVWLRLAGPTGGQGQHGPMGPMAPR